MKLSVALATSDPWLSVVQDALVSGTLVALRYDEPTGSDTRYNPHNGAVRLEVKHGSVELGDVTIEIVVRKVKLV